MIFNVVSKVLVETSSRILTLNKILVYNQITFINLQKILREKMSLHLPKLVDAIV